MSWMTLYQHCSLKQLFMTSECWTKHLRCGTPGKYYYHHLFIIITIIIINIRNIISMHMNITIIISVDDYILSSCAIWRGRWETMLNGCKEHFLGIKRTGNRFNKLFHDFPPKFVDSKSILSKYLGMYAVICSYYYSLKYIDWFYFYYQL